MYKSLSNCLKKFKSLLFPEWKLYNAMVPVAQEQKGPPQPFLPVFFSVARFAKKEQRFSLSKLFLVGCKRATSRSYNQVPNLNNMKAKRGREAFDFQMEMEE